jgi:CRISPR-associated protein Csc1
MTAVDIVEVELTPLDQLYYVSRESGDDFATRPYVMHTALYYAFGLLPSRFRVGEQTPSYQSHFEDSARASGLYIHPAVAIDQLAGRHTTRRFAVKGDEFRQRSEQENKNLKETGFQRFIDPDTTFRTFIRVDATDSRNVEASLHEYCRIGKKMTSTRIRTASHTAEIGNGSFSLDQPIGNVDLNTDEYDLLGDVRMESMMPVNILTEAQLNGPHVTIDPAFGADSGPVSLPTETEFLLQH